MYGGYGTSTLPCHRCICCSPRYRCLLVHVMIKSYKYSCLVHALCFSHVQVSRAFTAPSWIGRRRSLPGNLVATLPSQLRQQSSLRASTLKGHNHNEDDSLQRALQQAEERALDSFIETEAPRWAQQSVQSSFPFSCTACGKCCQVCAYVISITMDLEESLLNCTHKLHFSFGTFIGVDRR